jgi:hypothetical protein
MSAVDEILSEIPVDQLARQLGADEATTERAVRAALPALLGGMEANAQDPGGAASLAEAVGQHDPGLVEGGVNLHEVDTQDGARIVNHVFGPNQGQVVDQINGFMGGAGGDLVKKLLPILAPIVLAWLAKKLAGSGPQGAQFGGLVEALGGLLGGAGGAGGGGAGNAITDLLGGLLGAGRR